MSDDSFKHWFAYQLFWGTVLWAVFTMWLVYKAACSNFPVDIFAAAGASGVTGALTAWVTLVVQHYFRRAKPQEGP